MLFITRAIILSLSAAATVHAHMHLFHPPSFRSDNNPHTKGDPDPRKNYNYNCCGRTNEVELCKGYLKLLGTPEGASVADWAAGSKQTFTLSGQPIKSSIENPVGGTHSGGSGQIGFSVDNGTTFKAIKTWQGSFPGRHASPDPNHPENTFEFNVPADLPNGNAVFAWTWVNRENEFFMDCASVTITGGNDATPVEPPTSSKALQPSKGPQAPEQSDGPETVTVTVTVTAGSTPSNAPYGRRAKSQLRAELAQTNSFSRRATAFTDLPDMLIVDVDKNECKSKPNYNDPVGKTSPIDGKLTELLYPNPGPDVVEGDGAYELAPPTGTCKGASASEYHTGKQFTQA